MEMNKNDFLEFLEKIPYYHIKSASIVFIDNFNNKEVRLEIGEEVI